MFLYYIESFFVDRKRPECHKNHPQPSSFSYAYFVLGFRKMKIGNSGAVCGLPQIVVTILLLQKISSLIESNLIEWRMKVAATGVTYLGTRT